MKRLVTLITLSIVAAGLPISSFAAAKREKPAAAAGTEPSAPAAEEPKKSAEGSRIPMYAHVDSIDEAAKTFTHKNKNGVEVKFVCTDKTEIKQGSAEAKFSDIKVGQYVSGLRIEKSKTEYEVVKITKFGEPKPKAAKRGAAATPEPKKQ